MKLAFYKTRLHVDKEPGDPNFSGIQNAAGESRLLYHIKNKLNKGVFTCCEGVQIPAGTVWIKKRMAKDGHLDIAIL